MNIGSEIRNLRSELYNKYTSYLKFPGHGHHIMIWGVVLVAVRKHQSNICSKLLGVQILSVIHLPLKT